MKVCQGVSLSYRKVNKFVGVCEVISDRELYPSPGLLTVKLKCIHAFVI